MSFYRINEIHVDEGKLLLSLSIILCPLVLYKATDLQKYCGYEAEHFLNLIF